MSFVVKHTRVKCKNCGMDPIIGVRYLCWVKGYDACEKCFEKRDEIGMGGQNWKVYRKAGLWKEKVLEEGKGPAPKKAAPKKVAPKKINPAFIVKHARVKCKKCGMLPIIGNRYYCMTKPNYDLCDECFDSRSTFGMGNENWKMYHKPGLTNKKVMEKKEEPKKASSGAPAKKKINPAFIVKHARVKCKKCGMLPIIGNRYYCMTTPNYDLCDGCFDSRSTFGMGNENWKMYHKPGLTNKKVMEKKEEPKQFSSGAPAKKINPAFIVKHARVKCKKCEMLPIIGNRYYCMTTPNYDLCDGCFDSRSTFGMGNENWKMYHKPGLTNKKVMEKKEETKKASSGATAKKINPAFIVKHARVKCTKCGMLPIIGNRYFCMTKPNYDLCDGCFDSRSTFGMGSEDWKMYHKPGLSNKKVMEKKEEPKQASSASPAKKISPAFIVKHARVKCTKCGMLPIIGNRYYCLTKPNYDLCDGCFDSRSTFGMGSEDWKMYHKPGLSNKKVMEKKESPKKASSGAPAKKISPAFIVKHARVKCKKCDMLPIIGNRYFCMTKPNYDLCDECFGSRSTFGMGEENWKMYHKPGLTNKKIMEKKQVVSSSSSPAKKPATNPAFQIKHSRVKCVKCGMLPILGTRYFCTSKRNIDLCTDCFSQRNENGFEGQNWKEYHKPGMVKRKIEELVVKLSPHEQRVKNKEYKSIFPDRYDCKNCQKEPLLDHMYRAFGYSENARAGHVLCDECFPMRNEIGYADQQWHHFTDPKQISEGTGVVIREYHKFEGRACAKCKMDPIDDEKGMYVCQSGDSITTRLKCLCSKCYSDRMKVFGAQDWEFFAFPGDRNGKMVEELYALWEGIECKNCKKTPIKGDRCLCVSKKDSGEYSLCKSCFGERDEIGLGEEDWDILETPGLPPKDVVRGDRFDHKRVCSGACKKPIFNVMYDCQTIENFALCSDCFPGRPKQHNWEKLVHRSRNGDRVWERPTFQNDTCQGCKSHPIYFEKWQCTSRTGQYAFCGECFPSKHDAGHNWQQFVDWNKKGKVVKEVDFKKNCSLCKKKIEDVSWDDMTTKEVSLCNTCFKENRNKPKLRVWRSCIFPSPPVYQTEKDEKNPDLGIKLKSIRMQGEQGKEWTLEITKEGGYGNIQLQQNENKKFNWFLRRDALLQTEGVVSVLAENDIYTTWPGISVGGSCNLRKWKSHKRSSSGYSHTMEVSTIGSRSQWKGDGGRFNVTKGSGSSYAIQDTSNMFLSEKIAFLFSVIWAEEIQKLGWIRF